MPQPSFAFVSIVILILVVLILFGALIGLAPLKQHVVERFAGRQALHLTHGNAAHVVSALTITHRWRRVGLVVGLALGVLWALKDSGITLDLFAGFLGWFVGAVVAQWRIGTLGEPGERRAASLASRSVTSYVTRANLVLLGVAVVAWASLAVAAAVRAGLTREWWFDLITSLALLLVLALTARAIISRPSGFVDHDVREADDALRGHGLTVLAGSAIALLYPSLWSFALQTAYPDGVPHSMDPSWVFLILLVCTAVGWHVASTSRSVRAKAAVP